MKNTKKQDDYKDKMDETRGGLFQKPRRWEKPEKFL